MIGDGRRVETAIDQTYMEHLYKVPVALMAITPNITSRFEKFETKASVDIASILREETELFSQKVRRIETSIAGIETTLSPAFVKETLGNLTEDYLTRCKINHEHYEGVYRVHVGFLTNHFEKGVEHIERLAEERTRFHFISFPEIQPNINKRMEELHAHGNSTIEQLAEAWNMATIELFQKIADTKASISMEMDNLNQIIAPGNLLRQENFELSEKSESIVKETFDALNKAAFEFSSNEKLFMDEARKAFGSNSTLAEQLYAPISVREPQWAYTITGVYVNQIIHKAFEEFYELEDK